jgi:hypothetical protein
MKKAEREKLMGLVSEARPGPWEAGNWTVGGPEHTDGCWEWSGEQPNPKDARFIAALNPSVVKRLLEDYERLEGLLEGLLNDGWVPHMNRGGMADDCSGNDDCDCPWPKDVRAALRGDGE